MFLSRWRLLLFLLILLVPLSTVVRAQDKTARGFDLYQAGDYEGAVKELTPLAATKEDSVDWRIAATYLAASYTHLGKIFNAHPFFQQLVDQGKAAWNNNPSKSKKPKPPNEPTASPATTPGSTPLHILKKEAPDFYWARKSSVPSGEIWLAIEFRSDGTIGFVTAIEGIDKELIKPATDAAKKTKFEAETRSGKQVTVVRLIVYYYYENY